MDNQDRTTNYDGLPDQQLRELEEPQDAIMHSNICPDAQSHCSSDSRLSTSSTYENDAKRVRISTASSRMSMISSITNRRLVQSGASSRRQYGDPITMERGKELYTTKKFRAAYPIFDKLAQGNDIAAMYYRAVMLLDGLGVVESNREGLLALKKTYEESLRSPCDPEYRHLSCYQIGLAYMRGLGARQDMTEAVRWWLKAANEVTYDPGLQIAFEHQLNTESGTLCQLMLAKHYATLRPVPDWEKSYNWYRVAAQNGSVESMFQVGMLTWYGLGCDTTIESSTHETIQTFLGQAAVAGNVCAMGNLAMYCLDKQLQDGAFMWATKAVQTVKDGPFIDPPAQQTTLDTAVKRVMALPNNDNDLESITKAISMSYFVLAHLHNVGAVASVDKEKASEFFEAAADIDAALVQSLTNLLENELTLSSPVLKYIQE